MLKYIATLLLLSGSLMAQTSIESRNGITHLHSEGMPIARYLSENRLAYTRGGLGVTLLGNIYGTQNWLKRVNQEDGWLKTDAVRFEYGAEIKYKVADGLQIYTRHTMPIDRHDKSVGDAWNLHSYRWDSGLIYRHDFK